MQILFYEVNWLTFFLREGVKPWNFSTLSGFILYKFEARLHLSIARKIEQAYKQIRVFLCISNLITPIIVPFRRLLLCFSAKRSCSTKGALIWFLCRIRAHWLFSWWINAAVVLWSCGPCPSCAKGCVCLFSDIHDPKGLRHKSPVNETYKGFAPESTLTSLEQRAFGTRTSFRKDW